jgi:hypothetical protein
VEDVTTFNPLEEMTEEQLQEELERIQEEQAKAERERQDLLDTLAGSITAKFKSRQAKRAAKEQEWIIADQLYLLGIGAAGNVWTSPDRPFEASKIAHRPERNIVRNKCEIALAQVMSSQFAGGEKNWDLLPPDEIPPDMPDIAERCEAMEWTIANQMEDCGYTVEAHKVAEEWTRYGTGIMKGPCNYGKMKRTYVPEMDETGNRVWVPKVTSEYKPYLTHAPLWRVYLDDTVQDGNKGEDSIEAHPKSYKELADLKKNPGFMPEVIDLILATRPDDHPSDSYAHATTASNTSNEVFRNKFTVLEYHGPITRDQLKKLDIEPSYDMPGESYFGEVWVVNNKVIRIELENLEGKHRPPYSVVVWQKDPASPYGFGIPIMLRDHQRVVSQAWHMILDNTSASSGPQVVINQDTVEPADGSYELQPGKVWYFNEYGQKVQDAFQFFEVPNVAEPIFSLMKDAEAAAETESGIPLLVAGLQSPNVGTDSATGMAIVEQASTTLLDYKSSEWDKYITGPRIEAMYDWNMQYNKDDKIKAPMTVKVRPASEYRNKQRHIRDMEKLIVSATQSEIMAAELNVSELARAQISMMSIPTRTILKSAAQKQAEAEERAANPPPPSPEEIKAQVEMAKLEQAKLQMQVEMKKLELEEARLQFEMQQGARREEMDFEERQAANYARVAEAEARVVTSQNEKETAMIQLAAKAETDIAKEELTAGIAVRNDETNRYLKGLEHTLKVRDQLLKVREMDQFDEELKIKKQKGTGI